MSNSPSKAEIEALAKRHGATSYRNRADTQHPAYGFTEDGLNGLIDEVLAKWGTPQPSDCTRSHPHEDMSGYCLLRTEIARLANENARLKASQPVVREMECTCSAKDAPFSTCCKVREAFEQWYDSQEYGRLQPFDVFKGGWVSRGITQKGGSNAE